ncbi:MAG: hypothetical protein JW881_00915 [Spirochaetales bacterium]|nr:hypothetical protein [Spirochaetales bacterium]
MGSYSLYIIETGFSQDLPGFRKDTASSIFPFWGNYFFLDFICSYLALKSTITVYLLIPGNFKTIVTAVSAKWKHQIDYIEVLADETEDFIRLLSTDTSSHIIVTSPTYIALFNGREILRLLDESDDNITKVTIDNVPLNLFLVKRKDLLRLVRSFGGTKKRSLTPLSRLFDAILEQQFERMENVSGQVLFHNRIMEMYEGNLWLLNNMRQTDVTEFLLRQSNLNHDGKGMYVGESGCIKNSYISQGVEIDGYIENSIVFSNVVVQKNAKVINSVIMNNNRIGKNTQIRNAIIFPFQDDFKTAAFNIPECCTIGGCPSSIKNSSFPEHIRRGLTLIGTNGRLPRGFTIEPGVFLGPEYPLKELKNLQILKKGSSIYIGRDMENSQS